MKDADRLLEVSSYRKMQEVTVGPALPLRESVKKDRSFIQGLCYRHNRTDILGTLPPFCKPGLTSVLLHSGSTIISAW